MKNILHIFVLIICAGTITSGIYFLKGKDKVRMNRFDYSVTEFRGLHLPVNIIDKRRGGRRRVFTITPYDHLLSKDGYGD